MKNRLKVTLLIALVIPNFICSSEMARGLSRSESYYLPRAQWETYDYINSKVPTDSVVIALDFRDSQLLPVYTGANLFFSMPFGSTIKDQFHKFLLSWKYLGYDRATIEMWLASYITSYSQFRCAPTQERAPINFFFGYMTLSNILYDPYIKTYGEIPIREIQSKLSEQFVSEVLRDFDTISDFTELINSVDYILISKNMAGTKFKLSDQVSDHFQILFENDQHILLKKNSFK